MNWQDLAGALIKVGAPILGNALGGPLGGMIGSAIGGVIANSLGVDATPEAVDDAIKTTPAGELSVKLSAAEAEAAAKWPALAEIAKAEAGASSVALESTAATMRVEAVAGDPLQRWWRPIYAFELTVECALVWAVAIGDIMVGGGKIASFVTGASSLLSVYWGARFGVLGVYVGGRSYEKAAAVSTPPTVKIVPDDQLSPSIIAQIVKAVKRK